jgi:hypothetical protein
MSLLPWRTHRSLMILIRLLRFHISIIPSYPKELMSLFQIRALIRIIMSVVMKGFIRLNILVMKVSFGVLSLKIWSCQKDHNRFCN